LNAGYLAELVAEHRLDEQDAAETAADLALNLASRAFTIGR
jgi:glucuronate isomerase